MSEDSEQTSGNSGWLNGWLQTAKDKSSSVLEFMKKDLHEFTNTLQEETSSFVTTTTASLIEKLNIDGTKSTANKVKHSFSGFLDTVSSALTISPEPDDNDEPYVICDSQPVVLSRLELQILLMQRETSSYLNEPPGNLEDYEAWLDNFELNTKIQEMTELMNTNAHVHAHYGQLVPSQVSHSLFWHRYFYRVHQLSLGDAKHQAFKKGLEGMSNTNGADELELALDEYMPNGAIGGLQLTPQETDQILSDYQQECEERVLQSRSASLDTMTNYQDGKISSTLHTKMDLVLSSSTASAFPKSLADEILDLNKLKPNTVKEAMSSQHDISATESTLKEAKDCKTNSIEMSSSTSNKASELSNEDDWEKDFDVGLTYDEIHKALLQDPADLAKSQEGNDEWEEWQ